MNSKTFSITLSAKRVKFIDEYRAIHSMKSRSDVIEAALSRLQESEREDEISEAPEEDELSDADLTVARDRGDEGD